MNWQQCKQLVADRFDKQKANHLDVDGFYEQVSNVAVQHALQAYKISQLAPVQRRIFDVMTDNYLSTGQIALKIGRRTSNVTTQLQWMLKSGLIGTKRDGKLRYWKRKGLKI